MHYIRFSNAAIAADLELPAPIKAPREPSPPTKTFWALTPLQGKLGTYVALQQRGDTLFVGVRTAERVSWVLADRALTRADALAWFPRAGFAR